MKSIKSCLLLFVALISTAYIYSQTVDEIIAKHLEAIGGKEKLTALNSIRFDVTVDIGGNSAPGLLTVSNGKGYRNESDFSGQKVVQVYTDKQGWVINPFMGVNDPQALPDDAFKMGQDQIYIVPLLDYTSRGSKVELVGQERVGGTNTFKIKLTNKNNIEVNYYIDPANWYIIQTKSSTDFGGQKIELTVNFSDFAKNEYGWVVPLTSNIDFGGQFQLTSKITKTEINPVIDESVFAMKK